MATCLTRDLCQKEAAQYCGSAQIDGARVMKLLLVDDHALFREGVALLLGALEPNMKILEAGSYEEAVEIIGHTPHIDIILMDLQLPGLCGREAIAHLREHHPEIPVVAVSSNEEKGVVLDALDAGAMGFIPKTSSSGILRAALQLVLCKGIYLPPSVFLPDPSRGVAFRGMSKPTPFGKVRPVSPESLGLSERQSAVLLRILEGKPAKLISRELGLSASTVKVHTSAVLRALNVTTRTQAVVVASKLGLQFPG